MRVIMDSFTINKILGAVLGTFLFIFAINLASEAVFPGRETPEGGHGGGTAQPEAEASAGEEKAPAQAEEISLSAALAAGDAGSGAKVFKKCAACHSVEAADGNKIGPNLHGILGREVATAEGFGYSSAMQAYGGIWSYERLDQYLSDPKGTIPGNKMAFAGLKKATDRADVMLYLRESSPDAPPLPE